MDYFYLILGLVTLVFGGDFLVKGAVGIAKLFRISTLVVGMTVVSFGTSAPELIVSLKAAMRGAPELAIGNVIGSNIANIALVLAITVLIFPIVVDKASKWKDWPMMMFASVLFYVFSYDLIIQWWEGMTLFLILIAYTSYLIISSRRTSKKTVLSKEEQEAEDEGKAPVWKSLLFIALGLVGLFFGARWLLDGSLNIARDLFGDSEESNRIIGVTVVAFGTSVPELVTSAVAAFRKETDISIGNLIGSNIFNVMAVIGITAMVKPIRVLQSAMNFDMLWMLGISLLLLPLMLIGKKLGRWQGALLFLIYATYTTVVIVMV